MIYEYALEPELVATWAERKAYRYYMSSFEFGQGRAVARSPKYWKRLVWRSFSCKDDIAKLRLTELLSLLSQQMVRRSNTNWDPCLGRWIDNVEREHVRCPFHAIVARTNPKNRSHILTEGDLDPGESPLWAVSDKLVVARKAADMADAVASMLRCCTEAISLRANIG